MKYNLCDEFGVPMLAIAISEGDEKLVDELIYEKKTMLDVYIDGNRETLLSLAIKTNPSVARRMIQEGADIDLKVLFNDSMCNAFDLAIHFECENLVELLIDRVFYVFSFSIVHIKSEKIRDLLIIRNLEDQINNIKLKYL